MPIDNIFHDNLKEKLAGVLKEIPEWHLRGVKNVSLEYLNGKQLKIDETGELGCCLLDGSIILDYSISTPDILAQNAFLHELGHNVFNSLLPFTIKDKWAKTCKEKIFAYAPDEIFAEEYRNTILYGSESPLHNNLKEVFDFLEKNKERKSNGVLHKIISHCLYSKEPKAKSI